MIRDTDEALRTLLERAVTSARVTFDPVAAGDVDASAGPVVHLALRSVRPVDTGRSGEPWADVRDPSGRVAGRQPPPRWFRLVYRVEACAADALAAHAALGEVLLACVAHECLPHDVLPVTLADAGVGVPLAVVSPSEDDDSVLLIEVVAPVRPPMITVLPTPVEELHLNADQIFAGAEPYADAPVVQPAGPRQWSKVTIRERAVKPADPRGA